MKFWSYDAVMRMINVKFDPVKGHFDPNAKEKFIKVI